MADFQMASKLDYNKVKAKKSMMSGLFAGKKIDKANKQIKSACVESNANIDKTKVGKPAVNESEENQDKATYCIDEGTETQDKSSDTAVVAVDDTQAGESLSVSTQSVADVYAANTERFAQMSEDASSQNEEIVAQLEETFTNINDSGAILAANAEEIAALGAELETIVAEDAASTPTSMAAGAGQNSAYSLSIPTGGAASPSKAKGKNKGGLVFSAANQAQQAKPQTTSNAGGASEQEKMARTQAIYARLATIESSNAELMESIAASSDEALMLQQLYEEGLTGLSEVTVEEVAAAEEEQSNTEKVAETFAKITEYGQYTKLAGVTTQAVGTGMTVAGMTVKTTGVTVKGVGGLLNGIGGGLKALGAALLPGVFTAPAGSAVGAAGLATTAGGAATVASGDVTFGIGSGLAKAGITTQKIGKGVALAGEAGITVGSAGTMVTAIASGNIAGAISGALSFVGSATQFIGNAGQFAECIGKANEGFGASVKSMSDSVNKLMNTSLIGEGAQKGGVNITMGTLNQVVSFGSNMMGAQNAGDVIGAVASGMNLSNSSTGESSPSLNMKKQAETLGIPTVGRTDAEIQSDLDKVKPELEKAKSLKISTTGKTLSQIRAEIATKEAENKSKESENK